MELSYDFSKIYFLMNKNVNKNEFMSRNKIPTPIFDITVPIFTISSACHKHNTLQFIMKQICFISKLNTSCRSDNKFGIDQYGNKYLGSSWN